jgi:hypothetical protein
MAKELQSQAELKEAVELGVDEDILETNIFSENKSFESPSDSTNMKSETVDDNNEELENLEESIGVNDHDVEFEEEEQR